MHWTQLKEQYRREAYQKYEQSQALLRELKPIGRVNEWGEIFGVELKRGWTSTRIAGQMWIFKKKGFDQKKAELADALWQECQRLLTEAAKYGFTIPKPGCTTGRGRNYLASLQWHYEQGLLNEEEQKYYWKEMEFWANNPGASYGVMQDDGMLKPVYSNAGRR